MQRHPAGRPSFGLPLRSGLSQHCSRRRLGNPIRGASAEGQALSRSLGPHFPSNSAVFVSQGLGYKPFGEQRGDLGWGSAHWLCSQDRGSSPPGLPGVVAMGTNRPTSELQGTDALPQRGSGPRIRAWPPLGEVHTCSPSPGSRDTPPRPHHLQACSLPDRAPGLSQGCRRGGALPRNLVAPASPSRKQTVRGHHMLLLGSLVQLRFVMLLFMKQGRLASALGLRGAWW